MKKIFCLIFCIIIVLSYLVISPVLGGQIRGIPGIVGFTSMSDSLSMGSMSSGEMSSSSVEFSSDTLIMTGGTPKPTIVQPPIGNTGPGVGMMIVPPQWVRANEPGSYFDPVTETVWLFDPIFMTYFSPRPNWFLIVKRNEQGKIEGFFYYDVIGKKLYNSITGDVLHTGIQGGTTSGESTSGGIPGGSTISGGSDSTEPSGPIVATGSQDQVSGPGQQTTEPQDDEPCLVPCQSCPSGYCHDCNNNGNCDEEEGTPGSESETDSSGGISEEPQYPIQPTQTPQQQTGGMSEGPQNPIQIKLPIDIPEEGSDEVGVEGGQSESPQGSILYMLAGGKGPFRVLSCTGTQECVYCIDENDDEICSETDCHLISCGQGDNCTFCLDCNRDGLCDIDKIILTNCTEEEPCETFNYCDDLNLDGMCDLGGTDNLPELHMPDVDLLKPEIPLVKEVIQNE